MRITIRLLEDGPEPIWLAAAKQRPETMSVVKLTEPRPADTDWEIACKSTDFVCVDALIKFLSTRDRSQSFVGDCREGAEIRSLSQSQNWTKIPQLRGCNNLGLKSDGRRCCLGEATNELLLCGSMTVREQEVFQSYRYPDQVVVVQPAVDNGWTLVTGYWDLTEEKDSNEATRTRKHYLDTMGPTLALNQNLVIFCDPSMVATFTDIRAKQGLLCKTVVKGIGFQDFKLFKHRDQIRENRIKHNYTFDPRNTPSYYLLCMARYECLQIAMELNPFESTHFGWVDLSMIRMGLRNLQTLDQALSLYRNKFSTVWIDYVSKGVAHNFPEYFKWGRCTMCSGFFTCHIDYMRQFCDRIQKKFLEVLTAGYGHADSQLYTLVYFDAPELFEPYYGDAGSMITNYERPYDHIGTIIHLLITRSTEDRDYGVSRKACDALLASWKQGCTQIGTAQLWPFFKWYFMTAWYQSDKPLVQYILQELGDLLTADTEFAEHMQAHQADLYRVTDWALHWQPALTNVEETQGTTTPAPGTRLFVWKDGPLTAQSLIHQNPVVRSKSHRPAQLG